MNRHGRTVILAVEDDPGSAALLDAILGRAGYELHVVGDLASARTWLAEQAPSLILLDRHLPDGDGLELVVELRSSPRFEDSRILLVSASVLFRDRAAAVAAGADGFVPKPVRVKPLLEEVERQVGRAPQAGTGSSSSRARA